MHVLGGRKLERTHTGMETACKLHTPWTVEILLITAVLRCKENLISGAQLVLCSEHWMDG